jgi:hypothetical protein
VVLSMKPSGSPIRPRRRQGSWPLRRAPRRRLHARSPSHTRAAAGEWGGAGAPNRRPRRRSGGGSGRPLARGAPAAELNAARAARGGGSLTSRRRRGGGDGAGPHVGAVDLPVEQPRGRTMGGALPLLFF